MILVLGVCGIVSGITATFFKFLGELIESHDFTDYPMMTISLFLMATLGAYVLFYTINWAMRYYEQLDVIPTYFAQILVWTLLCGLIVLDEASQYTAGALAGIFIAALACFVGIQLLVMKSNAISETSSPAGNTRTA